MQMLVDAKMDATVQSPPAPNGEVKDQAQSSDLHTAVLSLTYSTKASDYILLGFVLSS